MSVLRNPVDEKIAQGLAALKTTLEACTDAGLTRGKQSKEGFKGNCRKRCQRKDIAARVAEIQTVAAELAEIDAGWIMLKAKRLLGWNLDDFLGPVQANGYRYFDVSAATREQLEVLAEFSQDEEYRPGREDKDGNLVEEPLTIRKVRLKPNNQVALLELMARIKGLVQNKVALTDPDGAPAKLILEVAWKAPAAAAPIGRAA